MNLSAPTPTFDPNSALPSDVTGFPNPGGNRDSNSSAASDFGAMLSARSADTRAESKARAAAERSDARSAAEPSALSDSGRSHALRSNRSRAEASRQSNDDVAAQQNAAASAIASAGAVEPEPLPSEAELNLSLFATGNAQGSADGVATVPSGPGDAESIAPALLAQGRPFLTEMETGKAQAGMRAYGLTGEGSPSRKIAVLQQTPAADVAAPVRHSVNAAVSALGSAPSGARVAGASPVDLPNAPIIPAAQEGEADAPVSPAIQTDASVEPNNARVEGRSQAALLSANGEARGNVPGVKSDQPENLLAREVAENSATESFQLMSSADRSPVPARVPGALVGPAPDSNASTALSSEALAEKIAARLARSADAAIASDKLSQKTSLTSVNEQVATYSEVVGINAAKPAALMSSPASLPTPASVAMEPSSFEVPALSFDALVKDTASGGASQFDPAARRAVESALNTAEQFTPGDQRFVRLQFSVGGEDLAVRVELRGDKVHTTFRTDSPELCTALAREWQAVSSQQPGERMQRLADPVFASSSTSSASGHSMSSDSGSARDHEERHAHGVAQEFAGLRRALRQQQAVPAAPASPAILSPVSTSRRLHTFA